MATLEHPQFNSWYENPTLLDYKRSRNDTKLADREAEPENTIDLDQSVGHIALLNNALPLAAA